MRVRLALVGTFADAHRLHAFRDQDRFRGAQIVQEAAEPGFEVQAVPQDHIGRLGTDDVAGGWFVAMDLGAGAGDRGLREPD